MDAVPYYNPIQRAFSGLRKARYECENSFSGPKVSWKLFFLSCPAYWNMLFALWSGYQILLKLLISLWSGLQGPRCAHIHTRLPETRWCSLSYRYRTIKFDESAPHPKVCSLYMCRCWSKLGYGKRGEARVSTLECSSWPPPNHPSRNTFRRMTQLAWAMWLEMSDIRDRAC